ncbi:hypothetical protein DL766_004870 [Monosporascus sp. MC13-8B]|uniref:UV-damage endonuclease n=1 Tax=Monosporascus cannonballus TaxID=155416 RepID=A0ABY0H778_9PEZI|nr:hypothetical protein DL762_004765 [Monosporascus cannonballus]RYO95717.1 hypothetical protein DL763_003608 [Monosporascus cannonballus]RYP30420.1 hypothetical protein DL766_004870 [Monosporascus sp. MC13-8B]
MALLYEHSPVREESDTAAPSPARRRSMRIRKHGEDEGHRPRGNPQMRCRPLRSNGSPEGTEELSPGSMSTKFKWDMIEESSGVNKAVESLRKMEDNLRNTVKRQKKVVDESLVAVPTSEGIAFFPRCEETGASEMLSPRLEMKGLDSMEPVPIVPPGGDPDEGGPIGVPEENDIDEMKRQGARPSPVNSDYLPLPWKGRLGYANPPVFSSRTCRITSILEHRHPLQDPSQPEHATKNHPDKDQPAELARGQRYVEDIGLQNARDVIKMLRWNNKYNIKFLHLSSEMFPFAGHQGYGYKLEPFAAETLAEVGKVAAELGHRLTMHPGQYTQLGSPRPEVIRAAIRDLEYHEELLTLLRLPAKQNKDAVMVIHVGGVYGDKQATLDRFRESYAKLSPSSKARLVLENDDVAWSVHDLLPVCEELNIPFVLDFHHHNIIFDADKIREGTRDIMDLFPRIKATWDRKGITQKMHYSEPCPEAVTPRQRRKHSPRVMTLPPCPPDMDLMIEAKDKEQAVLNLMRNFKLPGWNMFNDVIPYEREDENRRPPSPLPKKTPEKKKKKLSPRKKKDDDADDGEEVDGVEDEESKQRTSPPVVPESEFGMGGPNNRVFWPVGMEEWPRPEKREVKRKGPVPIVDGAEGPKDTVGAKTKPDRKKRKKVEADEDSGE